MANVTSVESLAQLQAAPTFPNAVAILSEEGRAGTFVWRSGNFAARIAADPLRGIHVPSQATMPSIGCWVRDWDGVSGRPEWFGARAGDPAFDNVAALTACLAACPVTQLAAADYYIQNTLTFAQSNKAFAGAPGAAVNPSVDLRVPARMAKAGGSRVILTGPRVDSATVLHFGRLDGGDLVINAVLRDISFCRDSTRGYRARNSTTADPIDCVKGIICAGLSTSLIENVSAFDSPVGWHCFGCVYTKWDDCSAWRNTPAAISRNDFSVGFLIGGYERNYGYAGSNASVYFNRCISYDLAGGAASVGMRLFGAVADTFLTQVEVGRCRIGIEIDGRGRDGATIAPSANDSQQDIHLINPIIDSTTEQGLQLRNLNRSFQISIVSPYIATAGARQDINIMGGADRVEGAISISGGVMLSGGGNGLLAVDAAGITLSGTVMRNYSAPLVLINCHGCRIEPDIFNYTAVAARGVHLKNSRRCAVKPIVRGTSAKPGFVTGVLVEGGNHNAVDPTMVDPTVFITPLAEHKVRYGGEDARASAAFKAAGNVLLGVVD